MIAEQRQREDVRPPDSGAEPVAADPEPGQPLPDVETLAARIPAGVREMLQDLFRAEFTRVERVRPEALKARPAARSR